MQSASAAVFIRYTGDWPETWPKALEPLRKQSKTYRRGIPLTEETVYVIAIHNKAEFKRAWDALLKVKSAQAPITLLDKSSGRPSPGSEIDLENFPVIRVRAPNRGGVGHPGGQTLKFGPPWPKRLRNDDGSLPEFVHFVQAGDRIDWAAGKGGSFSYRCRTELEVVVDGEIIDYGSITIPEGTSVVDRRETPPSNE